MALRLKARGTTRRSTVRSTRTLLSFAVAAGLTVHATTAVAAPEDSSNDSPETAEEFLASLVGEVSSAEGAVTSMENELGGLRESVNKARVDLERSQREAQEAQDNVVDARGRLDTSQTDVEDAQEELDEIARSAYTQGGDAAPVAMASGEDVAADSLDRATYIRMASEKQQSEIDRLDLIRTQNANEESSLRDSRDKADGLVQEARDAHSAAEDAYSSAQESIATKSEELEGKRADLSTAQARLNAAKKAIDTVSENAAASSFEKRNAAERAADRAESGAQDHDTEPDSGSGSNSSQSTVPGTGMKAETDSTESTDSADSTDSESDEASVEDTLVDESTAEDSTAEDAAGDETTGEEAPAEEPAEDDVPADDAGEGSDAALSDVPESFDADTDGDARRQAAIDGLVGAAGAAAFAGINSHIEGNPDGATDAAVNAARESAGTSYADLPAEGEESAESTEGAEGAENTEDTEAAEGTEGVEGTEGTDGTEGTESTDSSSLIPELPGSEGADSAEGTADNSQDDSGTVEEKIERVIDRGMSQMGTPYAWGGGDQNGPTTGVRDGGVADTHGDYAKVGFDCSGLMVYAFNAVGIQLEKYSGYQYSNGGTQVPVGEAKRGDMLFWGDAGTSHVALYLGDGEMLEAPNSGDVVKISPVRWDGIMPNAVRAIE